MIWMVIAAGVVLALTAVVYGLGVYWWATLGILVMVSATLLIQWVFDRLDAAEGHPRPRPPKRNTSERLWEWVVTSFTPTGGTMIGWLERITIFLAVSFLASPWAVVAAIIGFKSIGRYPEILAEQSPQAREAGQGSSSVKFVEKFLIGTALSVLIAVGAGFIMRLLVLPHFGVFPLSFDALPETVQSGA